MCIIMYEGMDRTPVVYVGACWWSIDSCIGVKQIIERALLGVISCSKLHSSIHK